MEISKVDKANETYDALTVKPEGGNIGVNLNAGKLFEEYENGRDFDAIAEQAKMLGFGPVPDEPMYVATVPDKVQGASVLAYQNFMDEVAGIPRKPVKKKKENVL